MFSFVEVMTYETTGELAKAFRGSGVGSQIIRCPESGVTEYDLLSTFIEIYRRGSVTAAARALGVTQSSVSNQLARLEQRLGETLFTRSHLGVRPTARGDELALRVSEPLASLQTALSTDTRVLHRGDVRIGGASDLMAVRVVPALASLTSRGIQVRIELGLAADLLTALSAGELDLVVSAIRPTGSEFTSTAFVDEEFVLIASKAIALTVDASLLASDPTRALAHIPLVAYATDLPIIRRYWLSVFGTRPANRVSTVVPDLRAVLAGVVAGSGMSVLPRYLAEQALLAGSVEILHQPEVHPLNTIYLAISSSRPMSPAVDSVVRCLISRSRSWSVL